MRAIGADALNYMNAARAMPGNDNSAVVAAITAGFAGQTRALAQAIALLERRMAGVEEKVGQGNRETQSLRIALERPDNIKKTGT